MTKPHSMTESSTLPAPPETTFRRDYQPSPFLITDLDLIFDLHEDQAHVTARLSLERNPAAPDQALVLDGEQLELLAIRLDGVELNTDRYRLEDDQLIVEGLPQSCVLETEVRNKPQENTALSGLYRDGSMFLTQCEAEGFRRITYYLDRPDVMARFSVRLEADRSTCPILLSNGNLVDSGEAGEGRHWARWEDPFPKPSYLFALVAGDLACHEDTFTTASGREVILRVYVERENIDRTDHAMSALKKSMTWDEQVFGLEYDLDIYMIVATGRFNMGAMENKGLNVFNSIYVLARPDTATDGNYEGIEGVIAHEYFHNWTGNRVTCRDWFQLSLKEGLTVFRDQEFSADMTSAAAQRIADVQSLRARQFPEDAGPMAHAVRPESYIEMDNFYTATVYSKGAEVVRMYQTLLGRDGFRRGMDLYFERHDGHAVTCDDFRMAMADANDTNLDQLESWYLQAGTPRVDASLDWDGDNGTATLHLCQECPPTPGRERKEPFLIPVAVGLLGPDGADLPLRLEGEAPECAASTRVLRLTASEQTFNFVGLPVGEAPPVPSLLRDFSAPVELVRETPRDELAFLMANDSDSFNRWEAGQRLAQQVIEELMEQAASGAELAVDPLYLDAFRRTLVDPELDSRLKAEAMALPSEAYLAEQNTPMDPGAIHAARKYLLVFLATNLEAELKSLYQFLLPTTPYRFERNEVGLRALKNACLSYISRLPGSDSLALLEEQFAKADNMTDSIRALGSLCNRPEPARAEALASFYRRWEGDALVIDMWFSVQANSDRDDVLDSVKALLEHKDFDLENPNRVRSLVASFCVNNRAHFHAPTGAGYNFLADIVLEMNGINPQIASRLVDPLLSYKRLEPQRSALMRAALTRIASDDALSPNVFEKINKALKA